MELIIQYTDIQNSSDKYDSITNAFLLFTSGSYSPISNNGIFTYMYRYFLSQLLPYTTQWQEIKIRRLIFLIINTYKAFFEKKNKA